jgi:hypothetical protein
VTVDRARETGTEEGVDRDGGAAHFAFERAEIRATIDLDAMSAEIDVRVVVDAGVAGDLLARRSQKARHVEAARQKVARHHEPIAAVVPRAAHDHHPSGALRRRARRIAQWAAFGFRSCA